MARHTDPVCRLCRREGMKLFLKGSRCESPKCAIDRRNNPPGMHGYRRGKPSEYGVRLREKQKLKRFYGVLERQFRRYFELASRSPENTGEVLLSILERRLDNIVHRLGFAPSRAAARQLVSHGHVLVNGEPVNISSFNVKAGDEVSVKDRPKSRQLALRNLELTQIAPVPDWLTVDRDALKGKVARIPSREEIQPMVNEQLIVELYSR